MFKYKHVENEATGERYWIEKAVLVNEEGPDAEKGDWYEVDLQPVLEEGKPIRGIDLIDIGGEIHMTEKLNPEHWADPTGERGHFRTRAVLVAVRGDTLVVPACESKKPKLDLKAWIPDEADRLGIVRELWFDYSAMMHGMLERKSVDTGDVCAAIERVDLVMETPLEACRERVQEMFLWFLSN